VAAIRVVLVSYPIAMVLLAGMAAVVGGHVSTSAIAWGALCGVGQAFGIPLRIGVAAGLLDTFGNVCMLLALRASLLLLAGVLISLYPAATVVLALVVLHERVTRPQQVGILLAGTSVALIAAG
jgi:drug/metabolite transporter (DMT)-like permease